MKKKPLDWLRDSNFYKRVYFFHLTENNQLRQLDKGE